LIVLDASVLSNAIADDGADGHRVRGELRAADELAAPDLVDIETVAVLRKRWLPVPSPTSASRSPSRIS
jgi:predicted nucleic acid-binding protein